MQYVGELISLGVAFSWTITALASEVGSRRLGVVVLNVWRLGLAMICSALMIWLFTGVPYPIYAGTETWMWLLLSGVVGYFFGDWCLFNSYMCFGSRYGQLFMTLAPMFAAISAWIALGQTLGWNSLLAMIVTLTGIGISVLGRGEHHSLSLQLPLKGVIYAIGAALGQGVGLVLSKIGLDHYTADVPATSLSDMEHILPFSANMIRCLSGTVCFLLWMSISGNLHQLQQSVHERKGMLAMYITVFFGPFLGVGFSLMAVQYTAAGIASTIMALSPILIIVPSYYLFHQKISTRGVIGAIISIIGVSLFFLL